MRCDPAQNKTRRADEPGRGLSAVLIMQKLDGELFGARWFFPAARHDMTLNKADLIKGVIEKVHLKKRKRDKQQYLFPELNYALLSRKQATHAVDSLIEIIKSSLEKGEQVLISGFGKFYVRFKWARKGRNPRTGKDILLDSRRIVGFRGSPRLKERINKEGSKGSRVQGVK
jgi:integration host factor subunit alpha